MRLTRSLASLRAIYQRMPLLKTLLLKRIVSLAYPPIITFEPTNACNLKCVFCARELANRPIGLMDFLMFKDIILDSVAHGKRAMINFQKDGEPLLHPKIVDMISYAKEKGAARYLCIYTNALVLQGNRDLCMALIRSGLDEITFSVNAPDPDTYRETCGADAFDRVEEGVRLFWELRKQLGSRTPHITTKMIRMKQTLGKEPDFDRRWGRVSDRVFFDEYRTWKGHKSEHRPGGDRRLSGNRYPCVMLWTNPAVNWDGRVSICCLDFDAKGVIGDIRQQSLGTIWKGEELRGYRLSHLRGFYADRYGEVCRHCDFWRLQPNLASWLRNKCCFLL